MTTCRSNESGSSAETRCQWRYHHSAPTSPQAIAPRTCAVQMPGPEPMNAPPKTRSYAVPSSDATRSPTPTASMTRPCVDVRYAYSRRVERATSVGWPSAVSHRQCTVHSPPHTSTGPTAASASAEPSRAEPIARVRFTATTAAATNSTS